MLELDNTVVRIRKITSKICKETKVKSEQWIDDKKKELSSRQYWMRKLPIIGWLNGYSTAFFISDLIAGLTVGLTVIPQGMACAVVAGLPPQYGLYSAFLPCYIYLFLGTSKDITIGPTAISAMLVKPYADKYGVDVVILVCFASGIFITILGIFQLGFLVDFISMPVLAGFISAGAVSIASSQVAPMLGFKSSGSTFLEYWENVGKRITDTKLWDPILCVICIFFLLLFKHTQQYSKPRGRSTWEKFGRGFLQYLGLGRNIIVVLIASGIIAIVMAYTGKPYVAITGPVKQGFPEIRVPKFEFIYKNKTLSFQEGAAELSTAIIIPFVLVLETVAIAKAFAKGRKIDATQEMLAVGLSNIFGAFFQSFPVTGSFTRTAVNNASGVKTPVGGIYTGTLVILCLFFLTNYLQYIPKATLAAVIICAVIFMIEIHDVTQEIWRSKKADLIPLYSTFLGCLFLGMDYGIVLGIAVNMLFILYEAARPRLRVKNLKVFAKNILLVCPDRSITYPAAEYVKEIITNACDTNQNVDDILIVVDGRAIHSIDSTAVKGLKSMLKDLNARSQQIIFWNWNKKIITMFVGFDCKGKEFFHEADSLEQLMLIKDEKKSKDENNFDNKIITCNAEEIDC